MTAGERPGLLRVQDARVVFGTIAAVDGVSLQVRTGEIVGLIGPNGAGKSTLLNAICGTVPLRAGRVWLGDQQITGLSVARRARLGLGRTFQHVDLFESMSVIDNVLCRCDGVSLEQAGEVQRRPWWRRRPGASEREKRGLAASALARVGLGDAAQRGVGELSYAERKLVEVARAIVTGCRLLVLDEPTAGVASEERGLVMGRIRELARGIGTVLVEHDMGVIASVCDRVEVMAALVAWHGA